MTRINLIPVLELTDEHLLAEHRELKRIPSLIQKWKVNFENIPEKFVLWTGHVKFFYDKLWFLKKRYIQLYEECKKRWFTVQDYIWNFDWIDEKFFWEFSPSKKDLEISKTRIREKLDAKSGFYKYYRKNI